MCQPGWEGVWGRMDKYIYMAESPFAIHLKLPQHRQLAIPQNKIRSLKLKKKKVKTGNKIRVSILTTPIQYISRNLSQSNQVKKRKGNQTEKKEVKLSLFPEDMILCIQNSKDPKKKMLELINSVKIQDTQAINKNLLHFH